MNNAMNLIFIVYFTLERHGSLNSAYKKNATGLESDEPRYSHYFEKIELLTGKNCSPISFSIQNSTTFLRYYKKIYTTSRYIYHNPEYDEYDR